MSYLLYLDPGTGSLLAQILGGILGAILLFKNSIVGFFVKYIAKKKDISQE